VIKAQTPIALILATIYLLGLSLQGLPALVQATNALGNPVIEKQCPNKAPHSASPITVEQTDAQGTHSGAKTGIFITCLSAQATSALQQELNVAFHAFRLTIPFLSGYHPPCLGKEPFPPRVA
jgi:hypothetical protein